MPAAAVLLGWIAALLAAVAAWLAAAARSLRPARGPAAAGGRPQGSGSTAAVVAGAREWRGPPAGPPAPWQELPDAVFAALLARQDAADVGSMRTACRSWRAATARVLASLQPARPAPPARLAAAFPSLTTLDLSRWCQGGAGAPLEARALVGMARLVQLRELRLGSGERLGASSLRSRGAAAFPGAGAAFLGDGPDGEGEGEGPGDADGPAQPDAPVGFPGVGEAALCALPLLQLSALDLSGCVHAGDAALMGLSRLRALRSLRMRRCGGLTDAGLVAVALLPALTRLDVSECPLITNLGLRALARPPLEDLSVSSCLLLKPRATSVDCGLPDAVARLTRLRRLAAHHVGDGDDGATLAFSTLRPLSALSALTKLSIGSDRSGQELRSIHSAWLETQRAADDGRAAEAAEARVRLARRLTDLRCAAGHGLAALGTWLPRLQRLSVAACMLVAPSGDDAFAGLSQLGELEDLRLTLQQPPTGSGCLSRLSRLTRLELDCATWASGGEASRSSRDAPLQLLPAALTHLVAPAGWVSAVPAAAGGVQALTALRVLQLAVPLAQGLLDDLPGCLSEHAGTLRALHVSPAARVAALLEAPRAGGAPAVLGSLTGLESLRLGWFTSTFERFHDLLITVLTGLARLTECLLDGLVSIPEGGGDVAQKTAHVPALLLAHPSMRRLQLPMVPIPAAVPVPRRVIAPMQQRGARLVRLGRRGGPALISCWEIAHLGAALQRLDLAACLFVDDTEFAGLRELSQLTCLDISGCARLSDASLSVVARHMPALAVLRASGCLRFSDRGVAQLAPPLAATLLELRVGGVHSRITDAGLAHLAALTCLTALQVSTCPHVTDAGLPPLTRLGRLSALDLVGCGVTAEGVMALAPLTRIAWLLF